MISVDSACFPCCLELEVSPHILGGFPCASCTLCTCECSLEDNLAAMGHALKPTIIKSEHKRI